MYSPDRDWDRNPQRYARPKVTLPPDYSPAEAYRPPLDLHTRSQSDTATLFSSGKDAERPATPRTPRLADRLTKQFFNIRMASQPRSEWIPMQHPRLQSWPPLDVEKRHTCDHCQTRRDRRRRNMALIAALLVFLLFLFANIIFLNVRVVRLSSSSAAAATTTSATSFPSSNSSATNVLSTDAQQCLSQYTLNAPSDPQSYPCSTCLPVLQDVPANFSATDATDGEQIQDAIQFCGLRGIFDTASSEGQQGLSNEGWVKDVRFCAWQGVHCDGFGRVSTLQLTFPAVPTTLPSELTALTSLTSLQIIGDTNVPAGSFPTSFGALNQLATLHLESTALNSPSTSMLGSLGNLTTLTLVKNANMTSDMTSGFASLPLQNLVINSQTLPTNPISTLLTSAAGKTLQTLDLSSTSLSGSLPSDLSAFSAMLELHLDTNALTNALPSIFPPNLHALTLTNNTQLNGVVNSGTSFCALAQLQTCSVTGTGLSAGTGGCGVCQFS